MTWRSRGLPRGGGGGEQCAAYLQSCLGAVNSTFLLAVLSPRDHFFLTPMQPACYAHCWDTSGTRLFTCGGPLAFGLVGCYMGLWQ